ncbi:MAG: YhcH/YjgK/YiaL family protein [Ignavibacteria bacterium]|nr:YhcH/YjgK/YiaL family protein [Ignavibacteria bacterium]
MILDKIENYAKYFPAPNRFAKAFRFLLESDLKNIAEGKHEIVGEDVYIIISSYETKKSDESNPEAHRVYADIQYIITGSEKIGYSFFSGQGVFKEYDTEKDYLLYNYVSGSIILDEGMFAVFFPDDIHQPG